MALPFVGVQITTNFGDVLGDVVQDLSYLQRRAFTSQDSFMECLREGFSAIMEDSYYSNIPSYSTQGMPMVASGASAQDFDMWTINGTNLDLNVESNGLLYANQGHPGQESPPPRDIIADWALTKGIALYAQYELDARGEKVPEEKKTDRLTWLLSKSIMGGRVEAGNDPIASIINGGVLTPEAQAVLDRCIDQFTTQVTARRHDRRRRLSLQQLKDALADWTVETGALITSNPSGYLIRFPNRVNGVFTKGEYAPRIQLDHFGRTIG